MGHATAKGKVKETGKIRTALVAIGFALSTGMASQATAALITFEHTSTGSITGTLNGVPFATNSVSLVGIGDTENVVSVATGFRCDHTSSFVEIAGLGTFVFTSPTRTFVSSNFASVSFSMPPVGLTLHLGPVDPAFADWDMQTSIGPITGDAQFVQWGFANVQVTEGHLIFDNGTFDTTFTATVIPAPSALSLFLAVGALGRRRRRS